MSIVEMRGAWWRRPLAGVAVTALAAGGFLAFADSASAAGNTIYVNPGGVDSPNCGTTVQQCLTIQQGIDRAETGDTVKVAPGTYSGPVLITKAITLQSDGDASIDGADLADYTPADNALVTVTNPGGDVTIDGFTIKNAPSTDAAGSVAVNYIDTTASDVLTFTHNIVSGNPSESSDTDAQIGFDSSDTAAHVTIQDSEFSGVFQGILLEGVSGPVDVSSNVFHDLDFVTIGASDYPGEGVYILSDKGTGGTDQNIVGNTFRDYGGIGIAVSAGYDLGGCAGDVVCNGSVDGSITDNTFDLTANDADVEASAIRLRALHAGNELNLTIGHNVGQVTAPTRTITESAGDGGTINVTPGSTPSTIVPQPAPSIAISPPATVTTAEPATEFTGSATLDEDGDDITNARYDVSITGTSGITAAQLKLDYKDDEGDYVPVALTGAATSGHAITGSISPLAGSPLAAGSDNPIGLRLAVPSATAPAGALTVKTSLDEVSAGTGNPVLNTVATDSDTVTVKANSKPVTPAKSVSVPFNSAGTAITLAPTDVDGDSFVVEHTFPTHGTLTGTGTALTYVPDTGYAGTDSFTYSANDGKAGTSTGIVTITVAKAVSSLGAATYTPTTITTATAPSVTIPVSSAGTVDGGTVTVTTGTTVRTATVAGGKVTVPLIKYTGGSHTITAKFNGTATAAASAIASYTFTVNKVATTLTNVFTPKTLTSRTTGATATVTATAAASVEGGSVVLSSRATPVIASGTIKNGKVVLALPKLTAGARVWTVTFGGTRYAEAKTITLTFTVGK